MENTAQQKEQPLYDIEANQQIPVGEGVCAVIRPYTDERFDTYRKNFATKINELLKSGEAKEINEAELKQAMESDCELCDELLETLSGYDDLPADWKNLISVEDKLELIQRTLNFVIDEDKKKFSLGGNIIVPTACYFNGQVANQTHVLRRKTIDDSSRYALIKSKEYKVTPSQKFGQEKAIEFTLQDDERAALYDEMRETVEGFKGDKVPKRVKILVVDYVFASSVNGKK